MPLLTTDDGPAFGATPEGKEWYAKLRASWRTPEGRIAFERSCGSSLPQSVRDMTHEQFLQWLDQGSNGNA